MSARCCHGVVWYRICLACEAELEDAELAEMAQTALFRELNVVYQVNLAGHEDAGRIVRHAFVTEDGRTCRVCGREQHD